MPHPQRVLVTGAATGIGRATALAFADAGAHVCVNDHGRPDDAARVCDEVRERGGEAFAVDADVSSPADVVRLACAVDETFGRLDVLVNNAAEQHVTKEPLEIEASQLERTFRTNVFGYFFMTKAALREMQPGACIVNTTSVTAYRGSKELIDYAATRGAIVAFTRSLAKALVERKIRVNGVAPGPIWTPLIPASFDPKRVAEHGGSVPMQRPGQPNEVASCHVFLASEEASYMTGQVLHPDGGGDMSS